MTVVYLVFSILKCRAVSFVKTQNYLDQGIKENRTAQKRREEKRWEEKREINDEHVYSNTNQQNEKIDLLNALIMYNALNKYSLPLRITELHRKSFD